jgi:hypothetical protein
MTPDYSGPLERGGRRLADRALAALGVQRTERVRLRGPAIAAGALSGLVGGLGVGLVLVAQGLMTPFMWGVTATDIGLFPYVVLSVMGGMLFGALFGHRPNGHGAILGSGLAVGLLWWMVRSLTLRQLIVGGSGPDWSLADAASVFPALIGDLVLGGVLGLGCRSWRPRCSGCSPSWGARTRSRPRARSRS